MYANFTSTAGRSSGAIPCSCRTARPANDGAAPVNTSNAEGPCYTGKKGAVRVVITNHARSRFRERWSAAFPGKPSPNNIDNEITGRFNRSRRVTDLGEKGKKRLNRYGADTLFFRADGFTFVVQDRSIVTIEISDKDMRHLNRSPLRLAS